MTTTTPRLELRFDWPYDSALAEMEAARADVVAGGPMRIFVGSHREEVVTLGRNAPEEQLVFRELLERRGVLIRRVDRGGGATAHGPGQLVVYPVVHLESVKHDVVSLTCALLRAAGDVAVQRGLHCDVRDRGLFVHTETGEAKLASVGFRVMRGVVTHGLALNVDNDLSLFDLIAPCGVKSQRMAKLGVPASQDLARELGVHTARRCVIASQAHHPGGTGALA